MILVLDASVVLKWFFRIREDEPDCAPALALLGAVGEGRIQLLQPDHFVAEVAAVLARKKPEEVHDDILDLLSLEFRIADEAEIYATAVDLSIRLGHHLFDTLYHAVALRTSSAILVTADQRYYDKASHLGQIMRLSEFRFAEAQA